MGERQPTQRERELALKESASRRADLMVNAFVGLVMFPFYIVDKLRMPIGASLIGYSCLYLPLTVAAGKKTELIVQTLVNLALNEWAYWALVLVLTGGNILQYYTHHRYVQRKGQREKQLESMLDPRRSSSGLSPAGTPPKIGGD